MVKTNSLKAWFLAARPKTLTGAIAPVLVGAAFAFANCQLSTVNCQLSTVNCQFALCLLFAIFMQINANLINDYFDFKKGTDREDRLGPERACAQGWITPRAMQWGIAVMTFLSCCVGLAILLFNLQWELLLVGIFCVLFCFLYTTHLSYLGWGDLLVLIFFGFVPVVFTCYVMCPSSFGEGWGGTSVLIASLAMGLATDNLLMVNNYRDRHQDKVSGKHKSNNMGKSSAERKVKRFASTSTFGWASLPPFSPSSHSSSPPSPSVSLLSSISSIFSFISRPIANSKPSMAKPSTKFLAPQHETSSSLASSWQLVCCYNFVRQLELNSLRSVLYSKAWNVCPKS